MSSIKVLLYRVTDSVKLSGGSSKLGSLRWYYSLMNNHPNINDWERPIPKQPPLISQSLSRFLEQVSLEEIQKLEVSQPLTISERSVAVALDVSLGNDYFSRHGGWGLPFLVGSSSQLCGTRMLLSAKHLFLQRTTATKPLRCLKALTLATLAGQERKRTRGISQSGDRVISNNDDYFATIHHISNIVRRDIFMERTLNKMRISGIVNSELVYRVLRSCCNSGIESFRFFNWARTNHPSYEPTTVEFEEVLRTLARTRHWETMWKVAEQMKNQNLPISSSAVSFMIEQYGKHGLVDQAVELFNKAAKSFNCPQTTEIHNSLLFALCEIKNFHGAYALIRRMVRKGVAPDKRTYSILVNGWCSAGKMREAQEFLEEMSRKGFNPPVRGRDLLIDGLLNAGYLESAKEMVRKMIKEDFVPDVKTFNSLAEALCKSEEIDFCIDLYHDACRLGTVPDLETYKIMISAASKVGKIDEAFRILHSSVEDGHKPFPSLYAPVLKELCRRGQFDDAFSCFSDMKVKGHPPNRPVYTMLIKMCIRGGRYVDAANYLVEMTELNLVPMQQTFDMVTDGLKNCGKHDLAERIQQLEVSIRGRA